MTVLGVAFSTYVEWDNGLGIQPRLFLVNVGTSATARKSTGARLTINLLKETFARMEREFSLTPRFVQGFGSIEGLMAQLKRRFKKGKNQDGKKIPIYPPPTIFYSDELDPIMKRSAMPGSVGTFGIHQLLDGNELDYPLKNETMTIRRAHMGLISNCTTPRFRELWGPENIDNGCLNRAMIVGGYRRKILSNPPEADRGLESELICRITELIEQVGPEDWTGAKARIGFSTPAAAQMWDWFYGAISEKDQLMLRRIDFIGFRLMMIQSLVKGELSVSEQTVDETIAFLNYQVAVRQALQPDRGRTAIARIQNRILAQFRRPEDRRTKRELQRNTKRSDDSLEEWTQAFSSLIKGQSLQWEGATHLRRIEW
jgi:hypothetical protein